MLRFHLRFLFVVFLNLLPLAFSNPDARRLYDDLLGDETLYNKNIRPVADHREGEARESFGVRKPSEENRSIIITEIVRVTQN